MTSCTFTYHRDAWSGLSDSYPEVGLTLTVSGDAGLNELLEEFAHFLSAAGYSIDPLEHLEFLRDDE